jgi:acetyltransferase-like isoleucine patch superfamily enzyme
METRALRTRCCDLVRIAWAELVHKRLSTLWARAMLWLQGAGCGPGLVVRGRLRLRLQGRLLIGSSVRMNSGKVNFIGGDRRMNIWVGPGAQLHIADGCALSNSTICCSQDIRILADTFIGGGCSIVDTDFHPVEAEERIKGDSGGRSGPVAIGPRAFIGAYCIILKDVTIGEGAILGAGSVATKDVPPFETWAGSPAKCVRKGPVPSSTADDGEQGRRGAE